MVSAFESPAAAMTKRTRRPRPKRPSPDPPPRPSHGELPEARRGVVVTLYSGSCRVESDGCVYECFLPSRLARDQRSAVAAGDVVSFAAHGGDYRVEAVSPRRTVL